MRLQTTWDDMEGMAVRMAADVVVAGAGAAGLAASMAAASQGAEVLLLEASETYPNGSTSTELSSAGIPAGGSRWQAEAGVDDSPELFFDDIMVKTKGRAHRGMARTLAQAAPDTVHWLADHCGVPLLYSRDSHRAGHSRPRTHTVRDRSGRGLLTALLAAARTKPGIRLDQPWRLRQVDTTAAGVSLVAERPDGEQREIQAGSVILATAGFAANPDLVARFIPSMANRPYYGGHGSQGDALAIASALGADVAHLGAYQGYAALAMPQQMSMPWTAVQAGAYLVNAHGQRFSNEAEGWAPDHCEAVGAQPGGFAWMILDERIRDECRSYDDFKELERAGGVRWVEDEAQLAELIGAPEGALRLTMEHARQVADGTAADPWGRASFRVPLRPPFGAVKVVPALFHTQGGVVTDGCGRVLRAGKPIDGVYAAGGAALGMSGPDGSGYLPGNGLLSALALGRLSGLHAGANSRG